MRACHHSEAQGRDSVDIYDTARVEKGRYGHGGSIVDTIDLLQDIRSLP
jgi:hypothetical protein